MLLYQIILYIICRHRASQFRYCESRGKAHTRTSLVTHLLLRYSRTWLEQWAGFSFPPPFDMGVGCQPNILSVNSLSEDPTTKAVVKGSKKEVKSWVETRLRDVFAVANLSTRSSHCLSYGWTKTEISIKASIKNAVLFWSFSDPNEAFRSAFEGSDFL